MRAPNIPAILTQARADPIAAEHDAVQYYREHPRLSFSGAWWSTPSAALRVSTSTFPDGASVGVWCVEDACGATTAAAYTLKIPEVSVLEISSAEVWAELCRAYPVDVRYNRRGTWNQATGRPANWPVPDWAQIAADYDGVHLPISTYVAAAGTVIPVNSAQHTASLIAGLNPDVTFWFTDRVSPCVAPSRWELHTDRTDVPWVRQIVRGGAVQ